MLLDGVEIAVVGKVDWFESGKKIRKISTFAFSQLVVISNGGAFFLSKTEANDIR